MKRISYLVLEVDANGARDVPAYGLRTIAEAESIVADMRRERPQSHFDVERCAWIDGRPIDYVVRRFRPLAEERSRALTVC